MRRVWVLVAAAIAAALAPHLACSAPSGSGFTAAAPGVPDGAADGTPALDSGRDATDDVPSLGPGGTYDDFPSPIYDTPGAPANAGQLFGPSSQGIPTGGPCLTEPEIGALYPHNWLRPRFLWAPAAGENLFELRLHVKNQVHDLVVYTTNAQWTMPQALWDALRTHSADTDMTLAVRGAAFAGGQLTGEALGSTGPLGVAPVDAPGNIVYWTTAGGSSLKGFAVGDETVGTTLVPAQVAQQPAACIGCHVGTPDGEFALVGVDSNTWSNAVARIDPDGGAPGAAPPFLGAAGQATLQQGPLGIATTSKAHWAPGDHVALASDGHDLVWIDLEAQTGAARGALARSGNIAGGSLAGAPAWSHDGSIVVYVATNHLVDGRLGGDYQQQDDPGATADLASVPYAGRQGGAATAVPGASDPAFLEYYPAFSPDDAWLAFNRAPNDKNMYDQLTGEIFVVPAAGGVATRLAANDPPACSGRASPGVTNSWPKWAPSVAAAGSRQFYWLVFSSTRAGQNPQLFVTAMVVSGTQVETHAALYLWNQPPSEGNHTPAWEFFNIPRPPPR